MTHIIVATHGKFSEEIVNSAAMVFGEDENTHVVTFLPGEGGDDLVAKYNAIIEKLPENEPVLFLVDLFGGSPYNAAARVAANRDNTDIVTGISLPMLLEVLDAKDGADLEELAETAKEVGVMAVKSFRNPEPKAAPAPKAEPAPVAAPAPRDPNLKGNMNITLLRIDDRLIHGQVATSWAKAVKCEAIFAISDEVANDKLRSELLLQIVPPGLKGYVIPVEKAIKVYHNPQYTGKNILWLVTKPADVLRLIEGGVKIDKVNVGGMTYKDGNKMLSDAVTVGKADVEAFHKLLDLGVDLTMQKVATNPKVEITKAKLDALQF
ncbi:mannose/fructose/sorbose PTS transporter subunit IIA [Actinobacillus porcinus]|uniref:PTS system mannose-specific EIIAB component n=1 Tax=Actinobacillus porcinus TaxID=51048 RepID=A0ABY6TMJ7_9PAST|nr:mannose/fructose/sorbose PTS transporter subunit IIA [Actinobacillus porcinus]MDY6216063.1 mannose/fructose/sorbose PTS transporter subunit IIA [Actinobacillus porcinus]VFY93335.1 PTS system mannose/fructose/sorbose family transporter subunit IIA [Actinobacillus porcinus]VTU08311.1 PTS system mannose/fructose/sorbose family transporter subunit IIA [Actinobacillus porcinus]